jgi:aryl-alcohol dehydrogenase-like predicted oxidoreductase
VGETFSGVDFDKALEAVEHIRALIPEGATMAQLALRWILTFDAVTCAIPGGKTPAQVEDNMRAADLPAPDEAAMARVRDLYYTHIREAVHDRW